MIYRQNFVECRFFSLNMTLELKVDENELERESSHDEVLEENCSPVAISPEQVLPNYKLHRHI